MMLACSKTMLCSHLLAWKETVASLQEIWEPLALILMFNSNMDNLNKWLADHLDQKCIWVRLKRTISSSSSSSSTELSMPEAATEGQQTKYLNSE